MYPTGVNKYYDMHSFDGIVKYYESLIWYEFCDVVGVLFLWGIPLDYILDWFEGLNMDRIGDILWYYLPGGDWVIWGYDIKVQDGWRML